MIHDKTMQEGFKNNEPKQIGYIFYGTKFGVDETNFLKLAREKNVKLVMFNIYKKIDLKKWKKKAKSCEIIYNNSGEEKAIKYVKLFEKWGCRVIESSRSYYREENKWGIYLRCKKNKIPTPRTTLLPNNIESSLKKLQSFDEWPVILKKIYGCQGTFVSKAENIEQAEEILKRFNKSANTTWPTIAQRFVPSPSYRVLTIDKKIVQTAIKDKGSWKKTGVYTKTFKKIKMTKSLYRVVKKIIKNSEIRVCGIDLLKRNGRWYILELNGQPCLGFFEEERKMLINKILNLLIKEIEQ